MFGRVFAASEDAFEGFWGHHRLFVSINGGCNLNVRMAKVATCREDPMLRSDDASNFFSERVNGLLRIHTLLLQPLDQDGKLVIAPVARTFRGSHLLGINRTADDKQPGRILATIPLEESFGVSIKVDHSRTVITLQLVIFRRFDF